jgi:hypothetical protein
VDAACHFWHACHIFARHGALGIPCCCSYRVTAIIIIIIIITIMPSSTSHQLSVISTVIFFFHSTCISSFSDYFCPSIKTVNTLPFLQLKTLVTAGFRFSGDSKYVPEPLYSPHVEVFCDPSQAFHLGRCDPTFVLGDYFPSFNEGSRSPNMSAVRNLVHLQQLHRDQDHQHHQGVFLTYNRTGGCLPKYKKKMGPKQSWLVSRN